MGGLSGTLTSLTQLHVPELGYLYKVGIGRRGSGAVARQRVMSQRRLTTGRDEQSGTQVKGSPVGLKP